MDWKQIWNDPVWSKVIAGIILAAGAALLVVVPRNPVSIGILTIVAFCGAAVIAWIPLREKLKQHWLVSILLLCAAVAGETWQIAQEVLVAPRNFQIAQLQEELQNLKTATPANRAHSEKENPLVLEETGVFEGNAITTRDGRCSIRINRVSGDRISLSVAIDALKPVIFESQKPGDRVPVDAGDQTYYVNIHRVRGSIVDLAVYQRRK